MRVNPSFVTGETFPLLSVYYGGNSMCKMLMTLFNIRVVWDSQFVPNYWREGLMVSLFEKGDEGRSQ